MASDGGYASKVVAEYARLYQVAYGKVAPQRKSAPNAVPTMVRAKASSTDTQPVLIPVMAPAKPTTEASVEKIAAL